MGREMDECNIPAFFQFCMRLRFWGFVRVGLGGSELGVLRLLVGGMRSNGPILHIRYSSRTMRFIAQALSKHLIIKLVSNDKLIWQKCMAPYQSLTSPNSISDATDALLTFLNVFASLSSATNPVLKSCMTIGINTVINVPIIATTATKITTLNR